MRVRERTVRRMLRDGELDGVKVGKEWRIPDKTLRRMGQATLEVEGEDMPGADGSLMSTEAFLRLPVVKTHVQLIRGYVVRDPAPFVPHQRVVGDLYVIMRRAIEETGRGLVLLSPTDVVVSDDTVLQPDLLAVTAHRSHIIERRVDGPPDLVVEVEATTTRERDMTAKRMLYAEFAVREYWCLSGERRTLLQMIEPSEGDYTQKRQHDPPAVVRSAAFPNLEVDLAGLFEGY